MDEQKLVNDSLQITNFTFPAVTGKNIVYHFQGPCGAMKTFQAHLLLRVFWDACLCGVVRPQIFVGKNTLTLNEQQYFVLDTAFQSTKWQETLEVLGQ